MGGRQTDSVMSDQVRERLGRVVAELRASDTAQSRASGTGDGVPGDARVTQLRGAPQSAAVQEGAPDRGPLGGPERSAVPSGAIGRVRGLHFTRRHLVVVAALLLLGALVGGYALTRSRSIPVTAPVPVAVQHPGAPTPAPGPPQAPSATGAASPTPAAMVRVHVAGEVRRPGVHTLPLGSRVVDAIEAAGGLTPAGRPGELNLAQQLTDGQQVLIGGGTRPGGEVRGGTPNAPVGGTGGAGGTTTGAAPGGKVNLNSATEAQLDALPGVGPVTAQKIVAWRTEHGRFTRIEELQEVPGIGPKSFAELAPHVTV